MVEGVEGVEGVQGFLDSVAGAAGRPGEEHGPVGVAAVREGLVRSRGDLTTKIHLSADGCCWPLP
ncbi:hypothetical protein OG729_00530 [Streptomyces sp. NBC_00210]|uniref:hypothetical protein n=1 Tax=Streptomyces sp. NBC_00210 TaxID=2903636 RepID=UPI003251D897